jgi:hypothetical protein
MVTTTTWSMREFAGLGKFGRTPRADVILLNGKDGASTAAPEARTRFFTNSRRRIFTRTLREEEIGGEQSARPTARGRGQEVGMIGKKGL